MYSSQPPGQYPPPYGQQYPQPWGQPYGQPYPPPRRSRTGLWVVLVVVVIVLLGGGTALFLGLRGGDDSNKGSKQTQHTGFTTSFASKVPTYAGNPVYDPCGLVTMDTVAKDVNGYRADLDRTGRLLPQHLAKPIVLDHQYIDRDIPTPLGRDGQPHDPGVTVGPQGPQAQSLDTFTSLFDANCTYSQGQIGSGVTFAKIYVTQRPTPLAPGLLNYLGAMGAQGNKKQVAGIDVYTEPNPISNFYLVAVVKPDNSAAVIIKSGTPQLATDGAEQAATLLAQPPKGPVSITYPTPFQKLINPCPLISADDFTQYTQKPASALADENLVLSELGGPGQFEVQRSCDRLEVDRSNVLQIAESNVSIAQWDTAEHAKQYVQQLKSSPSGGVTSVQQTATRVGDDSYIKVGQTLSGGNFSFEFRIGAAVITVNVNSGPPNTQIADYERRLTPIAQRVAQNYQKAVG